MSEDKKFLEVKNLKVEYTSEGKLVHAVNGVTFHLDRGRTVGLVGETGAGKTSIAKAILRILPNPGGKISDGEVYLEGEDILKRSERGMRKLRGRKISMIFQDPMTSLNPVKKVVDQIAEVIKTHNKKMSMAEATAEAIKMLGKVGIAENRAREYPHQFSGGMKQRVVIAMALSCEPELLIADEPTTALDVTIQAQILQLLKQLNENEQMNIILITHDLGVVASLAKRIEVMYGGLIMEEGTTEEIFEHPTHPYTRALLHAIPICESGCRERLAPIPGMAPSLANPPAGCPFVTRCRFACEECKKGIPSMRAYSDTQSSRCIFTKEELDEKEKKEEEK